MDCTDDGGAGRLPSEKVLWGNIPGLPTVDDDDDGARRLPLGGGPCGNIPGLPAEMLHSTAADDDGAGRLPTGSDPSGNIPGLPAEFPIPGLATSTLARLTCAQSRAEP